MNEQRSLVNILFSYNVVLLHIAMYSIHSYDFCTLFSFEPHWK